MINFHFNIKLIILKRTCLKDNPARIDCPIPSAPSIDTIPLSHQHINKIPQNMAISLGQLQSLAPRQIPQANKFREQRATGSRGVGLDSGRGGGDD